MQDMITSHSTPSIAIFALVFSFLVTVSTSLLAPFTETPTNPTYVALGSVARLKWNFLIHGSFRRAEIHYKRTGSFSVLAGKAQDGTIQTNPNEPITKRITIEGNATLEISGVKAEDITEYKCVLVLVNGNTVQGGVTQLILIVAPTIIVPASMTINENQDLTIYCASSGTPTPNVTWVQILSNGGNIIKKEGKGSATLFEPKIKRPGGSTGKYMYECQARNIPNGAAVTNRTEVIVQYLPEGTTLISSPSNTALQGDQVTFTCSVSDANPTVDKYTFYFKNGNTWTPKKQNKDGTYVMNVQGSDQGAYSCVPHNAAGNGINASVWLTVNVPPNITKPPSDTVVKENEPLQLTCEASGQPTPNIAWTKDRRQLFVGNTLDIKTIKRGESGTYVCNADNNVKPAKTASAQVTVQYGASITRASFSPNSSWIGQTVELTCEADGVPEPTITLFWPNGTKISEEKKSVSKANVALNGKGDFGNYKCEVDNGNGFTPHAVNIKLTQINKPGPPTITLSDKDIQATSLTVRWNPPIEDGGSSVTGYRVIVRLRETDVKNVVVGNVLQKDFGELKISTNYTLEVSAINLAGEGRPATKDITTKFEGVPKAAELSIINTSDPQVFELQWTKPKENGWPVTNYTIYKKLIVENGDEDDWVKVETVKEDKRAYTVTLEAGKQFKIVVTASNNLGEAKKEENRVKTITVPELNTTITPNVGTTEGGTSGGGNLVGNETGSAMIIGAAVGAVLFAIIAVALGFFLWRRRKHQENKGHGRSSSRYIMDGSAVAADQRIVLQNLGAGTEGIYDEVCGSSPVYAQVDTTKRMRNRSRGATPSRRNLATEAYENPGVILSDTGAQFSPSPSEYMPLAPSTRSWELKRSNINVIKIIGKGAFSKVGKATATGLRGVGGEVTVAVKMLKENAPNSDRRDLLAELELMKTFKPHPHVIKLLGCVTESEPPMVVIEYVPYGDLLGYLRKSRGLNDDYYKNPDVKPRTDLTSQQLMKFAWQIADGMNYLALKKVIHRDLAARNVLVGEGEKCKVTDFGMARDVHQDDIYTKKSRGRLPVKWTAYESLLYGVYTTQSDVWSYGIVMYEIFTIGGRPYPNVDARCIAARLQEGYRMSKPAHLEDRLYGIMTDCWKENPSERPTFSELKGIMAKMERNHRTYINLREYDGSLYVNLDDLGLPLRS